MVKMSQRRKLLSVCIPAYNRAHHLAALLDSILRQEFHDYEVVICEDMSPERQQIAALVRKYESRYPGVLRYFENETNLGYDGNIRNLVEKASGKFCFFMGNDDIMCEGAMETTAAVIARHPYAGLVLKSYGWFDEVPEKVNQEVRWFNEEKEFAAGIPAIRFAFRRSGVISGYIVHRDAANEAATSKFDGTLYYQMHLTASVLVSRTAVCTPKVLVLCRNNEPPDFGNSDKEKGKYIPGGYTPQARVNMIGGAISIVRNLKETQGIDVVEDVVHDYANYFYPYIKDQLRLPIREYWKLYRAFWKMGFSKYKMFHMYFLTGYLLGEKRFDGLTRFVRGIMGRSPHFGAVPR
jgi:glycosyltransferase involved in cell wall biosynthesis